MERSSICSIQEYERYLHDRAVESDIENDQLMIAMLLLEGGQNAAKFPARVLKITRQCGSVALNYALLDDNLSATVELTSEITNGIIDKPSGVVVCTNKDDTKHKVMELYFRDYFESTFGRMLQETVKLTLT